MLKEVFKLTLLIVRLIIIVTGLVLLFTWKSIWVASEMSKGVLNMKPTTKVRKGSAAQWQRRNKNFMRWLTVSQGRT